MLESPVPDDHWPSRSGCLTSLIHGGPFVLATVLRAGDTRCKVCVSPHTLNPLTGRIVQQLCGPLPLHYCRSNIAHLCIRTLRMMHRCDTVPEELVGRGFKSPSSTRVQLTIYAGQLGLAMTGFSLGYTHGYSSGQSSPKQPFLV